MSLACFDSYVSCGVREINGVHDVSFSGFKNLIRADRLFQDFSDYKFLDKGYMYLFSDNTEGRGKDMARWIRKFKLGDIHTVGPMVNPNSGLQIQVWVWKYNGRKIPTRAQEPK